MAGFKGQVSDFVEALLTCARQTAGEREEGGNNRGPDVDLWNRAVGNPLGSPWCAAWVFSMHGGAADAIGMPNPCPRTGSSHALWTMADPASRSQLPAPGDVFVVDHGNGLGHCGIVEAVSPSGDMVTTIEGNTNSAGSREGNAVARHTWNPRAGARGVLLGYVAFGNGVTG